jgi:hypothetical protein
MFRLSLFSITMFEISQRIKSKLTVRNEKGLMGFNSTLITTKYTERYFAVTKKTTTSIKIQPRVLFLLFKRCKKRITEDRSTFQKRGIALNYFLESRLGTKKNTTANPISSKKVNNKVLIKFN